MQRSNLDEEEELILFKVNCSFCSVINEFHVIISEIIVSSSYGQNRRITGALPSVFKFKEEY